MSFMASAQIQLHIENQNVSPNDHFCVPVTVDNFKDILTIQFTVKWNPAVIQFDSVSSFQLQGLSNNNFGISKINQGIISFSWFDGNASGKSLADGATLFSMCFTTIGTEGDSSQIAIVDLPIKVEVTDINSNGENIGADIDNSTVYILKDDTKILFSNLYLNPSSSGCSYLVSSGIDSIFKATGTVDWNADIAAYDSICCLAPGLTGQNFNVLLSSQGKILLNFDNSNVLNVNKIDTLAGFCFTTKSLIDTFTNIQLTGDYFALDFKLKNNQKPVFQAGKINILSDSLHLVLPEMYVKQGQDFSYPIIIPNEMSLHSFSGAITFDASSFLYNEVYTSKIPGFVLEKPILFNNKITIAWKWQSTGNPFDLLKLDTLFSIKLNPIATKGSLNQMGLSQDIYPLQFSIGKSTPKEISIAKTKGIIHIFPDVAIVSMKDTTAKQYDLICMPVKVQHFNNITAFNFYFKADAKLLQFVNVVNLGNQLNPDPIFKINADDLTISWQAQNGNNLNLTDGGELLEICYQVVASKGKKVKLFLSQSSNYISTLSGAAQQALDSSSVFILVKGEDFATSYSVNINNCVNDKNGSILILAQGGTEPYQYTWSNGLATSSIYGLSNGVYKLTISDSSTPPNIDTLQFKIVNLFSNPSFLAIADTAFNCPNEIINIHTSNAALIYNWEGPNLKKYGKMSVDIVEIGEYTVEGIDPITTCSTTDSFVVKPAPPLESAFVGDNFISACDEAILTAIQTPQVEGKWTGISGNLHNPHSKSCTVDDLQPGLQYFVWSLSTDACQDYSQDTTWVYKRIHPIAYDDVISKGIPINILANDALNPGVVTIEMVGSTPKGISIDTNGIVVITSTFNAWDSILTYKICDPVCNDYCAYAHISFEKDTVSIIDTTSIPDDPHFTNNNIPNAISPNGDGFNDNLIFDEITSSTYSKPSIIVFNRAGRVMYESKHYKNDWQGKSNDGKDLPQDTYYYVLTLDLLTGKTIKGPITIFK